MIGLTLLRIMECVALHWLAPTLFLSLTSLHATVEEIVACYDVSNLSFPLIICWSSLILYPFSQTVTVEEIFARYDVNHDGFWDQAEQWRMLKVGPAGGDVKDVGHFKG